MVKNNCGVGMGANGVCPSLGELLKYGAELVGMLGRLKEEK